MTTDSSSFSRRQLLATSGAVGALGLAALANPLGAAAQAEDRAGSPSRAAAIRPFRVGFTDVEVRELRTRVIATRWPDKETVADHSQGAQLARVEALAAYWARGYDWRKAEAKLNALPQFITNIDGLDIHFIHVRSKHANAMPLLMTHGWPGSVFELLKVVGPLTDPTAHGGRAEDAFHLVMPSYPGYGLSAKPRRRVGVRSAWRARFTSSCSESGIASTSPRAATGAPSFRRCLQSRRPKVFAASTSTCRAPYLPTC